MKIPLLAMVMACTLMTGCGARMVVPAGGNHLTAYAPLNESTRPGIVSYFNAGFPAVREARRESAYKQMSAQCQGRYRILAEGTNNDGGSAIHWGYGITTFHSNQWVYIRFACEPDMAHLSAGRSAAPAATSVTPPPAQETGPRWLTLALPDALLYPMPSFQATPSTLHITAADRVRVVQQQGEWVYVETAQGDRGWAALAWFQK